MRPAPAGSAPDGGRTANTSTNVGTTMMAPRSVLFPITTAPPPITLETWEDIRDKILAAKDGEG